MSSGTPCGPTAPSVAIPRTVVRTSEPSGGRKYPCALVTQLPDKPTLDGLEAKWRAQWEADGTYRFDRSKPRAEVFSIDTPPPTVSGTPPSGAPVQLHPHGSRRPLPADAGQGGLLPDGLGRQRAQRRAPRPAPHGHDRRPDAPVRPRLPPAREGRSQGPGDPGQPAELHRAVRAGRARVRGGVPGPLVRTSGCRSTGTTPTRASAPRPRAPRSAGFLRLVARDLAYRAESPTLWDVDMKHVGGPGGAHGQGAARGVPQARLHRARRRAAA